ncbi:Uncharacterized protein dnm_008990 [Desulfonema magnum]|uniref:Uncharacterized protein n=1 Tax=Desulfonema magnum TaxID=45655 RepID=A0A975GKN0_9BACT|nr:Uncharacterized protein dnm_008990 [Desulfonema magnum]
MPGSDFISDNQHMENDPESLPGDWEIPRKCPGFVNPGRAFWDIFHLMIIL